MVFAIMPEVLLPGPGWGWVVSAARPMNLSSRHTAMVFCHAARPGLVDPV